MKITFHGAAQNGYRVATSAGSQRLPGFAGLRAVPGPARRYLPAQPELPFRPDQAGRGDPFARPHRPQRQPAEPGEVRLPRPDLRHTATAHLANIMLLDSAHIQEIDAEYVNKKNAKRGQPPVEPLYTVADASLVAQYFQRSTMTSRSRLLPGVIATLVDAGHILGSAAVVLDIEENGERREAQEAAVVFGRYRAARPAAAARPGAAAARPTG